MFRREDDMTVLTVSLAPAGLKRTPTCENKAKARTENLGDLHSSTM